MKSLLLKIIFAGLTIGLVPQAAAMQSNSAVHQPQSGKMESSKKIPKCWILTALSTLYLCSAYWQSCSLDTMYANKIEAPIYPSFDQTQSGRYFFESKKYGETISIAPELQKLASKNITVIQLLSEKQDGPTCLKYAFSNLVAIKQLHKDGKAITAKNIAQEMALPLKKIGFPGEIDWKKIEKPMLVYSNPLYAIKEIFFPQAYSSQMHAVSDYQEAFFPNNDDFGIILPEIEPDKSLDQDISETVDDIIAVLNKYGALYILFIYKGHATAISIIKKNSDNNYLIIFMDSNNEPHLKNYSASHQILTNLIINFHNKIHNKPLESIHQLHIDGLLLLGSVGQILVMTSKAVVTKLMKCCSTNKERIPEK